MFDVRRVIAEGLFCNRERVLITRVPVTTERGLEATYGARGIAVHVVVSEPYSEADKAPGQGPPRRYRRVTLTFPGAITDVRIGVDDEIAW